MGQEAVTLLKHLKPMNQVLRVTVLVHVSRKFVKLHAQEQGGYDHWNKHFTFLCSMVWPLIATWRFWSFAVWTPLKSAVGIFSLASEESYWLVLVPRLTIPQALCCCILRQNYSSTVASPFTSPLHCGQGRALADICQADAVTN